MANTNASDTDHSNIFTSTCNTYFERIPYSWQSDIEKRVINLFLIPTEPINQLYVFPTGVWNTLLFTTIYAALKVAGRCITQVIFLSADQS